MVLTENEIFLKTAQQLQSKKVSKALNYRSALLHLQKGVHNSNTLICFTLDLRHTFPINENIIIASENRKKIHQFRCQERRWKKKLFSFILRRTTHVTKSNFHLEKKVITHRQLNTDGSENWNQINFFLIIWIVHK